MCLVSIHPRPIVYFFIQLASSGLDSPGDPVDTNPAAEPSERVLEVHPGVRCLLWVAGSLGLFLGASDVTAALEAPSD